MSVFRHLIFSIIVLLSISVQADGHESATYDVLVVGGGIAGLTASYELEKKSVNYKLFEAADRFGGRIKTLQAADLQAMGLEVDSYVNLGAAFIDSTQIEIRDLAEELGVELMTWDEDGKDDFWWYTHIFEKDGEDISLDRYEDIFYPLFENHTEVMENLEYYLDLAKSTENVMELTALDNMSFREVLDVITGSDSEALELLTVYFAPLISTYFAVNINEANALEVLDYTDIDFELWEILFSFRHDEKYRVVGGTIQIINALVEQVPEGNRELNMVLQKVKKMEDHYVLTFLNNRNAETVEIKTEKVILALGPQHLKYIEMDADDLPDTFSAQMEGQNFGQITNFFLFFDSPYWIEQYNDGSVCLEKDVCMWDAFNNHDTEMGALRFSIGAKFYDDQDLSVEENVEAFAESTLNHLEKLWPGLKDHYVGHYHFIVKEAWYVNTVGSYFTNSYYPLNYGNIYFAGSYYDEVDRGFMNGGVKSAIKAVKAATR